VDGPDLAELIGSRICHDLISPVGAIGNGVELLAMSGTASPELALISDSVESAKARIRFFRIAFGQASHEQLIGRTEVVSILTDLYRGARLKVSWEVSDDTPRRETRATFLILLCLENAMPYGGKVTVRRKDGQWQIFGEAEKTKQDDTLWGILEGQTRGDVTAHYVHFALVPLTVSKLARRLEVARSDSRIALTF